MAGMYCITDLLDLLVKESAEELRLHTDAAPQITVRGQVRRLDLPVLTTDNIAELFGSVARPEHAEELRLCGDAHFNYTSPHSGRFLVRASSERTGFTVSIKPV
jgi:twitching motility protein PilT